MQHLEGNGTPASDARFLKVNFPIHSPDFPGSLPQFLKANTRVHPINTRCNPFTAQHSNFSGKKNPTQD